MSYELQRRNTSSLSRTEQREYSREVEAVRHDGRIAEELVAEIGRVTARALYEATRHSQLRRLAERVDPYGAPIYDMITLAGAMEMTSVISGMSRRRYR